MRNHKGDVRERLAVLGCKSELRKASVASGLVTPRAAVAMGIRVMGAPARSPLPVCACFSMSVSQTSSGQCISLRGC